MLSKEKAIELAEKYLSKKVDVFKKSFFVLESVTEGTKYKPDGKDNWNLFDYHINWVEFVDNTEKHEERNSINVKINASNGKVYYLEVGHTKTRNKRPPKELIKKIQAAQKYLLDFLRSESRIRKVKPPSNIGYPLSIETHEVYGKVFMFKNSFGKFHVSVDSLFASDCWFSESENLKEPLDENKSLEKVTQFLNAHYPDFKKRNFEVKSFFEENRDKIDFNFSEKPLKGEVSIYENRLMIVFNRKKHAVESYHGSNLWIRRVKHIKITQEQAIKIFKKRFTKSQAPEARLAEKLDLFSVKTKTVWYIYDEHNNDKIGDKFCFGTYLEIDADTGQILKIGGFECS